MKLDWESIVRKVEFEGRMRKLFKKTVVTIQRESNEMELYY